MIIKLQNGDKLKIESDEGARRRYKEHSLLSIGLKLKRNLNIASNFLKSGPNITNFGNAVSALFGGFSPENPDIHYGEAPGVGIKNFGNLVRTARVAREFRNVIDKGLYRKGPSGWQENIKVLPIPEITRSKPYIRWSQKGYLNEAYNIEGGPGLKFLVVKDVDNPLPGVLNTKGNGEYSLHFHSTRDNPNKEKMFQALAESIPEGGKVSTWGTISKGGYHGINRFGELFGWPKVGERPAVNGSVNIFLKPQKESKHILKMNSNIEDELTYSIPLYYPERFTKPYIASEETKSIINNIVFPRLLLNRPNINVGENFDFGNIYKLPWQVFEKAGEKSEGFFNKKTGKIVRKDYSNYYADEELDSHELRHRIASQYPYTEEEQNIVKEAFENFENANINKVESGYPIEEEIPTTINDARNKLLFTNNDKFIEGHWVSPGKYIEDSGTLWYDLSLEDLNRLINEASPSEIIYSYHSGNDYGRNFIEYLENNNLLNQSRLEKLRKALFIGSTIPFLMPRKEEKK